MHKVGNESAVWVKSYEESIEVQLEAQQAEAVLIAPVGSSSAIGTSDGGGGNGGNDSNTVEFAPLGFLRMFNCGGSITDVSCRSPGSNSRDEYGNKLRK